MANETKQKLVGSLTDELKSSGHVVVTEYQGMTAVEFDELRATLRPLGGKYKVIKNRLARIAFDKTGFSDLNPYMKGPSAIVYNGSDISEIAKSLFKFGELHTNLKIKAGRLFGATVDGEGMKTIASLPSREVLMATLLARMLAPLTSLVTTLNEPLRSLHSALSALAKKKESAA